MTLSLVRWGEILPHWASFSAESIPWLFGIAVPGCLLGIVRSRLLMTSPRRCVWPC